MLRVAVPDFILGLTDLVADHRHFMARSKMFQLFDYQRAMTVTPENIASTRRWVRMTTALTTHEAQALLERHDFSGDAQLLDVGGNSGEFAIRICAAYPQLNATILDLPVVCRIGEEHVRAPRRERASGLSRPMPAKTRGPQAWTPSRSSRCCTTGPTRMRRCCSTARTGPFARTVH